MQIWNGAKGRINWFIFQRRVDTVGCKTQTKIRWINTNKNHASFKNNIHCIKLQRTVCYSYSKETLLQTLTSKLLAFLSLCVHMSRPKGRVGPVLLSPWFKALYFLGCYTFCTRKNFKGTEPFSNLKATSIISITRRKRLVNDAAGNVFIKHE